MKRTGALHLAYVSADRGVPVLGNKGGSTHIRELVNALAKRGANVRIVSARLGGDETRTKVRAQLIEAGSAKVFRALRNRVRDLSRGTNGQVIGGETLALMLNQEMYLRLQQIHARWGIDAIYERYSLWGYAALHFARNRGIPFVLEVNAPLRIEQAKYRQLHNAVVAEAIEAQLFQLADRVVVPSTELREYVIARGAGPGRVRVISNAADPDFFRAPTRKAERSKPGGRLVIGFVGSLKPWHGIQDLLRAFARLRRRDPSYELLIVGDGPLRPVVEEVRRRERLGDAIRVTGGVEYTKMPELLWQMDVGVAPYPRLPGFYFSPIKIYEYMAAGLPIVASAVGQITQVLTHRKTALLHPPGTVRMMVDHIAELHARPGLRARLAREARRLAVKKFTWDRNAARVMAMVQTLQRQVREGRHAPAEEPLL